jgi:hypothetical protein
MECLLSFGEEYFVSQFAVHKYKGIKIYKTITLPVVVYGCETWTLTLREKRRFRVFDNTVLRIYLGLRGTR